MDKILKSMDNLPITRPEGFTDQRLYRVPASALRRMRRRPHTRDFVITDLGYFPVTEGHLVDRPDGIPENVWIFVESGHGWLELDSKRFALSAGEAALLPAGRPHKYGAQSDVPWKIYWFHFSGEGAEHLLSWTSFSLKSPTMRCPTADGLRRQCRHILSKVERGYSDHALLELSRSLINVLTLLHARRPDTTLSPHSKRLERIMDYMREHLDRPEPLAHYARQCGLSVSRFSETFREHSGVSPMTYFTELRIQRACELLDTSELQVSEVATRLGFQDTLYFSRLFRKHTGMPPTAYRKLGIG